jgi:ElaB/YqjD/DUF883 family membrane-anchored ribosome-binding protein
MAHNSSQIRDKAGETAQKAQETGQALADQARDVAGQAYDSAKQAAGQAYDKARQAAGFVGEKADEATTQAGRGVRYVGDQIEHAGKYLEDRDVRGMIDDLTEVIKRNPVPALIIGLGVGYLIARATMPSGRS